MERSRGPQAVSTGSPSLVPVLADLIGTDGVVEELVLRGPVGVMALHGGLEAGTAPAGRQCARLAGASFYAVVQPGDFRWHVPSTRFDPLESRKLTTFLEHVKMAVSIHGFGRAGLEGTVLVGGRNTRVRRAIGRAITRNADVRVIADSNRIPAGLGGMHPRNPVNLPEFGGVQIELSPQARNEGVVDAVVAAVASVLAAELSGVCGSP